ncbi:XdhC family protein [Gottfriedia luciferensis]|uniref:XdhC family protein n=1 Tax=Gottfriedia luciferensis TaxID=178774 RepID=UPI000B44FC08|nr:XdhC family protein [Gottfriedia luciferensis]
MESIHEILESITSYSEGNVLATIIHVEGSAYRKEGTSMLFKSNGEQIGMLSAGCLEIDLSYRIKEISEKGTPQTIVYDMSSEDDYSWGQGAGCNGIITVILEPVNLSLFEYLNELKRHLLNGNNVSMMKIISDENAVIENIFVVNGRTIFGNYDEKKLEPVKNIMIQKERYFLKSGVTFIEQLGGTVYFHTYKPKPRLIVFGAGKDSISLVKFASIAGFHVIVTDWRDELCSEELFQEADQLIVGFPNEVIPKLQLTESDSVMIITHQFQKDREILNFLENKNLTFLGVLGGKLRTKRLLNGLNFQQEINSPAGLKIGAEGPEEIAISIVAELIQIQRCRKE